MNPIYGCPEFNLWFTSLWLDTGQSLAGMGERGGRYDGERGGRYDGEYDGERGGFKNAASRVGLCA